jgi:hypothetical protein
MRRLIPLLVIVAASLLAAPTALAAGPGGPGGPVGCEPGFGLKGEITAVDGDNGVLTVAVEHGSDGLSGSVAVLVTEETLFFATQCHDRSPIAFEDVAVGDQVAIFGDVDDDAEPPVYTAAVVCVRAPSFGLVGTVTAVDVENGVLSVAVEVASGDLNGTVDIVVTEDTRIIEAPGARACDYEIELADIAVGDAVGVWGTIDRSSGAAIYTATKVCVRVPRFGLVGAVTAVDTEGGVLSVEIDHASGDLSGVLDIVVGEEAELFAVIEHERTAITLADIAEGDEVAVFGTIDESTGSAVYTAHVVLDGVSADWLPRCRPKAAKVKARDARKGDRLKLRLRVADAMPGCMSATVSLSIRTAKGRTVARKTVTGVAVNEQVTVSVKLAKALRRGHFRLVATSTDWAGNRQAGEKRAVLTVK